MNAKELKYPIGAYAPGHYQNRCANCKEFFIGDKLARQCELCALRSVHQHLTKQVEELTNKNRDIKDELEFAKGAVGSYQDEIRDMNEELQKQSTRIKQLEEALVVSRDVIDLVKYGNTRKLTLRIINEALKTKQ